MTFLFIVTLLMSNTVDIHKYLMKKHDIYKCFDVLIF